MTTDPEPRDGDTPEGAPEAARPAPDDAAAAVSAPAAGEEPEAEQKVVGPAAAEPAAVEPEPAAVEPEPAATDSPAQPPAEPDSAVAEPTQPPAGPAGPRPEPRGQLWSLLRSRGSRGEALVAVLLLLLGFAVAVTVRNEQQTSGLAVARPEDLVQLLDDLDLRNERLRQEAATLSEAQARLSSGTTDEALIETRARTQELGVLAGTLGATGPGVTVTITDTRSQVGADVLVGAIEELRDAGAEAIDLSGIRVVASTYVVDRQGGVTVDGMPLAAPYRFTAIGDPPTLAAALRIPGGVQQTVSAVQGAAITITSSPSLQITSLHQAAAAR
ncbi:MAG TPA: DUF881 domain-containing protein [Frankiaceae bacterium]